jgi:5-methylcytosine-specific restriction endonuclease McrA
MNYDGIQKVSHLALHYLLSPKHGRETVRARVLELNLYVKDALHKGIYGVSREPQQWPTRYHEARQGEKPMICPVCGFKAIVPQQIQLHHPDNIDYGPKKKRKATYYKTPVSPICANCHSIEHHTGETQLSICGQWQRSLPGNRKYKDPSEIFTEDCPETYRLQKAYFLKWVLSGPGQYKCQRCSVIRWGKDNKLLSLEIHHKDGNSHNSLLSNLELLCPNCRAVHSPQPKD